MSKQDDLIEQRDRFLAFSLAVADLMLEIGPDDNVVYSFGAVKQLTGIDGEEIKGTSWTEIFAEADRPALKSLMKSAQPGKRCDPAKFTVLDRQKGNTRSVLVTAIRLPDRDSLYVTLAYPKGAAKVNGHASAPPSQNESLPPLVSNKEDFVKSAKDAMKAAKEAGQTLDMTLLDMPGLTEMKNRVSGDQWEQMMDLMNGVLKEQAVDGQSVTQLAEGRFGLLHDSGITAESIQAKVAQLLKDTDPEGEGVDVNSNSIEASTEALSEAEVSRALMYTLREFEKKGSDINIHKMDEGFQDFLVQNAAKIQRFKSIISNLSFSLHFQPIVSLDTLHASHYEMLTRFRDGTPPFEWITFGEDVGLAMDFDVAVCDRAIKYVQHMARNTQSKFTVNVSGMSIQNPQFFKRLRELISVDKDLPSRIMFEITESASITDLDLVNEYIGVLHGDGFKVCLDDFGAGSASFQYLQKLHVDYVKLDGAYVQHLMTNKRNETMVRSMAQLCKDLQVGMVAERIENEKEAALLKKLGVDYGQGYWFGKPMPKPDYKIDEKKVKTLEALTG